jgi:hypothetical protein
MTGTASRRALGAVVLVLVLGVVSAASAQDSASAAPQTPAAPQAGAESAPPAPSGPQATFGERLDLTAVTIPVQATEKGKPAATLAPSDLEVLEDGKPVEVIGVDRIPPPAKAPVASTAAAATATPAAASPPGAAAELAPAPHPWRVLIYVDLQLAGVSSVRDAAWKLGGQADQLAALGPVEIWLADDTAQRVFGPSDDAAALKKALRKTVAHNFGQRRMYRLRQSYYQESNGALGIANRRGTYGEPGAEAGLALAYARQERTLVDGRRSLLQKVLAGASVADSPQVALLISGGYDLVPGEFYLPTIESNQDTTEGNTAQRLEADFRSWDQAESNRHEAEQLSALGWTIVPVVTFDSSSFATNDVSVNGRAAWNRMLSASPNSISEPAFVFRHPNEPWRVISDVTGGELVTDVRKLDDAIEHLGQRWLVTYQVAQRRDGSVHKIELRAKRPGLELSGPAYISAGTPEAVADARALKLLDGGTEHGDLPVAAMVRTLPEEVKGGVSGRLEAKVGFGPLGEARKLLDNTTLRFTIAVPQRDGTTQVFHDSADHADLTDRGGWIYDARLAAPKGTQKVAVVVEELTTGAWGAALANWTD